MIPYSTKRLGESNGGNDDGTEVEHGKEYVHQILARWSVSSSRLSLANVSFSTLARKFRFKSNWSQSKC